MSRSLLISLLLALLIIAAGCAKRNTAYQDGDKLELIASVPVVGNPVDMAFGDGKLYVALDQGGLGVIDTQSFQLNWKTSLTAADGSEMAMNKVRLLDVVPEHEMLFLYDTDGTDDIQFINTSNADSLRPFGAIIGASQNIQDMIWRKLDNDPNGNLMEILYALTGTVYYGRYDGDVWLGNDFNFSVSYPIKGLEMDAEHIYVAADQRGLLIYSRETQQQLSEITFYGYAQKLVCHNDVVYVAARHGGLQIVDVSNPAQPVLLAGYNTDGYASDIDYHNAKVAVSSGGGGVYIFDVSNPANPRLLQHITDCGYANTVTFTDNKLAIASRDEGILFYSID